MKRISVSLIAILFFVSANAQPSIIVTPQWLNDHVNDADVVILQTGSLKLDYEKEHIKGSRFLWPGWLAFDSPEGSYNPPESKAASKVLQDLGVNKNSKIILVHNFGDVSSTARMFLQMEYLGLKGQVYYLNGGLQAWKKAGYPVTAEVAVIKKGNFNAGTINPVLVDKDYVLHALQNKSSEIVDARAKRFYDGDPVGNPRDGHITGALNLTYTDMIDSTNNIKPQSELLKNFTAVLPNKEKEAVVYCFIGQTASVLYLTGRLLGYNMKLYDGSMQEWSRIPELPMEVTKK
jgi:thiosulfate/3-mercaptopyruvate sulfurtransferase